MDLIAQLLVNGLINGSHYALLGLGFGLIFGPTRITHFAFGPLYALAAYAGWAVAALFGVPIPLAVIVAIIIGALSGVIVYRFLYRPFERRRASSLTVLIASLGLFIVLENAIGIVFGSDTKVLDAEPSILIFGAIVITSLQLMQILALAAIGLALAFFLRRSAYGKAMMAMTDDPEMARIIGIDTVVVSTVAFALGQAIASVPAMLILLKEGATPHMGFTAVFMGFVAVVAGGIGSLRGAVLGGYALGFAESLAGWQIPTQWQGTVAFVVLFLVLLLRPRGFLGRMTR
ncbi:MAG TPA: branched-chain amino acid ABC transporter permease [Stellaceae bacterium]|nr:branched-chain amino acid ABC transporter permease [Stellaceae bacterium]